MAVGIAEVDALAAPRPFGAAFDGDALGRKALLPSRELVGSDRKGDMDRTVPVMRRDGAAGKLHGFERMAAQEEKQDAAPTDVVGAQPLVAVDAVEAKHLLVECAGAFERLDIERGFENAEQAGHIAYSGHPDTGTTSRAGARTSLVTLLAATTT